jgi:coenzyme PQQ precursor peptide PqqA
VAEIEHPHSLIIERNIFMSDVQREAWETPELEEISLGFEITAYVNDSEFGR